VSLTLAKGYLRLLVCAGNEYSAWSFTDRENIPEAYRNVEWRISSGK
jgi:hypothetical protein